MDDIINSDKIFWHGSKGGIKGTISPNSPNKKRKEHPCDFGTGFYVGENKNQAKGVCIESNPVLYGLKVNFSRFNADDILLLDNESWLYTIMSFRKTEGNNFSFTKAAEKIREVVDSYEIVIGLIADDRMNEAIKRFCNGELSDKALLECLKYVKYGNQLVFKTERACEAIEIVSEKKIFGTEKENTRKVLFNNRESVRYVVDEMARKYRREGMFIDEIADAIEHGKIDPLSFFPSKKSEQGNNGEQDKAGSLNQSNDKQAADSSLSEVSESNQNSNSDKSDSSIGNTGNTTKAQQTPVEENISDDYEL